MISVMESHVKIFVDSITVPLRLGIFEHEKRAAQQVIVDVALYAAPSYLKNVDVDSIIDYGVLHAAVIAWAKRDHVQLIEDYLNELIAICFDFEAVEACRVCIQKADIFENAKGAGVEAFVKRVDYERF